ncbi:MAG: DUF3108 domain-containing protein [Gammaproteobacteria bacterium]|nr:DUF3108 domain-containing protein [Gammaproteobacteria bacterium]
MTNSGQIRIAHNDRKPALRLNRRVSTKSWFPVMPLLLLLIGVLIQLPTAARAASGETTTVTTETIQASTGQATMLTPFKAVYNAKIKGFFLPLGGEATRELSLGNNNSYVFESLARNAMIKINEQSRFSHLDNHIRPDTYSYERTGVGKNRQALLTFDWPGGQVLNDVQNVPWKMAITDGTLDKLVYQLQLRLDLLAAREQGTDITALTEFHYEVADGGRLKDYYFRSLGREVVETPLGEINALKLERIKSEKNRETLVWMDPDREYLLVKMIQVEKKGRALHLLIKSLAYPHAPDSLPAQKSPSFPEAPTEPDKPPAQQS